MDIRTEAAIAAFVPSLVLLAVVYTRDRYEREPKWLVARLYLSSILALALAFVLETATRPRLTGAVVIIAGSGLLVGLIEEGAKFTVLVWGTRRSPHLNEPVDGMIYASAVALGFAAVETLTYILRTYDVGLAYHLSPSSAAHLALTVTAPERALVGNLGHLAWAGIVGYAYGRWRCGLGRRRSILGAYVVAACGHGAYDALLGLRAPSLAYAVLAASVLWYVHLFRRALAASPFRHHQLRAVPSSPPLRHPAFSDQPRAPVWNPGAGPPLSAPPPYLHRFSPDFVVPPGGLPAWAGPDGTSHLVARLPVGESVQVVQWLGAWAHVLTADGWSGWVDGRLLTPSGPPHRAGR
jgi:RsiW-degrading membrane proteinase PrsW (M82 family)